jgi:ribonucleoside-triphosphate reductase
MVDKRIPVEVYSRVCGYFRPINQWNPGKQAEFKDRHEYKQEKIIEEINNDKNI